MSEMPGSLDAETPEMPNKRIAIIARSASREASQTASELADWLMRKKIEVALDEGSLRARGLADAEPFDPEARYDLIIVLGGDGTLLAVARKVRRNVPILGVNLGRLGFLTEIPRTDLYASLLKVLAGEMTLEERSLFKVEILRASGSTLEFFAFNDAVIAKSALARIIELQVHIDARLVARYRADGMIVSTPNGSTAYNLSAGGPIVHPTLPVAVVTPICPHALTLRPIVVPDDATIEIRLETELEEVFVTVDGQEGSSLGYHDVVRVRRADTSVRLVRVSGRTFYESLRQKLHWGG